MDDRTIFRFGGGDDRRHEIRDNGPAADTAGRRQQAMRRAVLRWLMVNDPPHAAAPAVPTRISYFKADVAAFWSRAVRNANAEGPASVLKPERTALIQCHAEREGCWSQCARSEDILPRLRSLKRRRSTLQERIRREEPRLREPDTLFEEYAEWRYEDSTNQAYHEVQREIQQLEHALLEGTRFERIRDAQLANRLYLAVPAQVIRTDELADGWGLLWVQSDLSVTVRREPEWRDCLPANAVHLVQNVAHAAMGSVLFAAGIRTPASDSSGSTPYFVKPPRGHRKPQYR